MSPIGASRHCHGLITVTNSVGSSRHCHGLCHGSVTLSQLFHHVMVMSHCHGRVNISELVSLLWTCHHVTASQPIMGMLSDHGHFTLSWPRDPVTNRETCHHFMAVSTCQGRVTFSRSCHLRIRIKQKHFFPS